MTSKRKYQDALQRLATAVEVSLSKRARKMFAKVIPNRTGPVLQDPKKGQKCSPMHTPAILLLVRASEVTWCIVSSTILPGSLPSWQKMAPTPTMWRPPMVQ